MEQTKEKDNSMYYHVSMTDSNGIITFFPNIIRNEYGVPIGIR